MSTKTTVTTTVTTITDDDGNVIEQITQERPRPVNHCRPWTPEEHRALEELAASGVSNRAIGEALGRTEATICQRRNLHGLFSSPPVCPACGGTLEQPPIGRKRRSCGPECARSIERERQAAKRLTQALATRQDWRCAADGCTSQIPPPSLRKFCCRECSHRASEDAYRADGRRRANSVRNAERRRAARARKLRGQV